MSVQIERLPGNKIRLIIQQRPCTGIQLLVSDDGNRLRRPRLNAQIHSPVIYKLGNFERGIHSRRQIGNCRLKVMAYIKIGAGAKQVIDFEVARCIIDRMSPGI